MVVQRHLSRAIRLRNFVALAFGFKRTDAAASRLDTMRLYNACGRGSLSLLQSDHEPARKLPHAAYSRVMGLRPRGAPRSSHAMAHRVVLTPYGFALQMARTGTNATDFVVDHLPTCPVANHKHRMHAAFKYLWASMATEAGAVFDWDRSGVGDLTLETSGLLRPTDCSRR
eukprot:jgi/Tetstr1/424533/TSEL_015061.t1